MPKLPWIGLAILLLASSLPADPAAEPGALLSADHWTSTAASGLLVEIAGRVQSLDPKDSRALARAGHLLLRAGQTADAADTFQRALKADPKDDEASILIATAYAEKKMWAEADEWFARAVQQDPKDVDDQIEWGVSAWNRGDHAQAAERFIAALHADPKNGRILYKIGRGIEVVGGAVPRGGEGG